MLKDKKHKRASFYNDAARIIIYAGGIFTIVVVLAILVFVFNESLPLFGDADASKTKEFQLQNKYERKSPLLIGVDEYEKVAYTVTDSATLEFIDLDKKEIISETKIAGFENQAFISSSKTLNNNYVALGSNQGKAILLKVNYSVTFSDETERIIEPSFDIIKTLKIDSTNQPIRKISTSVISDDEWTIVSLVGANEIILRSLLITHSIMGDEQEDSSYSKFYADTDSVTAMAIDNTSEKLIIGSRSGSILYYSLKDKTSPELIQKVVASPDKKPITSLQFLIGDQSVIVGDAKGNISSWMRVLDDESDYGWKLVQPHIFNSLFSSIEVIVGSQRDKSFIIADTEGNIQVKHLTSSRTLVELNGIHLPIRDIVYSPKSNGTLVLYKNGTLEHFSIEPAHPEITLQTIFGKVWYEGYKKPEYVWQSTGGTDDFESKYSLIPLIIGTFKGTFYALIFAIPIALFGALYTSVFAHPKIKSIVKPVVEIMAALPSVVIGFLAGLWLAPLLERILPGVFLMFFFAPIMMMLGIYIWNQIPKVTGKKLKNGYEVLMIIPLLILGGQLALWLGPSFESIALGGDYRAWLLKNFNQSYDQRNAIVVGFAMGFAVIPIIFTICEDALSSVPQHLTSGSLALGATKWQTAAHVILPTASPGIFSAIMIGFGRAIGETMIVLMATGNTPILDFSPFNGFRTLSANTAVEIPEAPYQGTLYRVLFLSAAVLFIMTFIVNTAAEIVRQRLRKKYMDI